MKIPTFILTYFDSDTIQKCINGVIDNDLLNIHIIENPSPHTEINKKYFLNLLKEKKIAKYFLMKRNISNNAFSLILHKYMETIKVSKYVLITDGDLVNLQKNWLQEEIRILENNPDVFVCGMKMEMQNLPITTFPDANTWIPPFIKVNEDYIEQISGVHFLLFRSTDFIECFKYLCENNKPFLDSEIHHYCYKIQCKKWAITKHSSTYHLTWDLYANLKHPYVVNKLSKTLEETWRHNNYCSYICYENKKDTISTSYHSPLSFLGIKKFLKTIFSK